MGEKTKTTMSTTTSSSSASPLENSKPVALEPPHGLLEPMEFLARTWSVSALEGSKTVFPSPPSSAIPVKLAKQSSGNIEESNVELEDPSSAVMGSPLSFATPSLTSQLVLERIMSQTQQQQQDVSPRTSGRLSHSSGPLNTQSCGGPPIDSPPLSPSHVDDLKFCRLSSTVQANYKGKTVGRWLKDRREKKKETRTQNAQVHAAVSVACVAAAVAAFAAATAASSKDEQSKTNMAVSSAATLVAAQCVEAAESLGADREHLTAVINSAVNVRTAGDIMTLTAAAALRGAATLKARALNDVWNIAAVVSVEKGTVKNNNNNHHSSFSDELAPEDNSFGVCSQELLARGGELLKRTRNGDLHWKLVSVYINREGEVALKMKSRHVAGTITKKKKKVVLDVCKNVEAWPGRHLLTGGENRRYFGLRTGAHRVIEFECRNQKEYELWTKGISRLLTVAREKKPLA